MADAQDRLSKMSLTSPRPSTSSISSADLSGPAKLEEVTRMMEKLSADLQEVNLLPHQRDALLEQLKMYGREPANADPIFTNEGIEVLTRHAFNSPSLTTSRIAMRCLANALLLKENTRQVFLDLGYQSKASKRLKNDNREDEFLVSRIFFLTTYAPQIDIENLVDEHHVAENICMNLSRHTRQYTEKQKSVRELDPMEDLALIESCKLLYNLTHFGPQRAGSFSPALQHILLILSKRAISSSRPLEPPIGPLINSMINLELEQKDNVHTLFPKATPNMHIDRVVEVLEKSIKVYVDDELEHLVSPVLVLLRRLYSVAPVEVQSHMQRNFLPSNEDRKQPLGRGESLPSRLLRLSTNATTPHVRDETCSLLFDLSGNDAQKFIQNIGYGFASGFLFQNNISVPESALEAWSMQGSDTATLPQSSDENSKPVNPITGQTLESEPPIEMPEMTQAEKEREAERLFVLFERLKKTGVMSVQNPVESALQEGRFLELDDDADSD